MNKVAFVALNYLKFQEFDFIPLLFSYWKGKLKEEKFEIIPLLQKDF